MLTWSLLYFALSFGAGLMVSLDLPYSTHGAGNVLCGSFLLLALCNLLNWLHRLHGGNESLRGWSRWRHAASPSASE